MGDPDRDRWFEAIYRAELAWVLRTARRLGVADGDCPDVAHDVFVAVYKRAGDFQTGRPLRPWLFGFVYRVVGNRMQAGSRRETPTSRLPERPDESARPDQLAEAAEARAHVQTALDELDLDQRAVCVLCDLEQLTAGEAAAVLQIPENTVYSRLRVARQRVAATLRRLREVRR